MRPSLSDGGVILISLIDFDLGDRGKYIAIAFCFPLLEDSFALGKLYGDALCIKDILLTRSSSVGEVGRLFMNPVPGGDTGREKGDDVAPSLLARVRPLRLSEASEVFIILSLARLEALMIPREKKTMGRTMITSVSRKLS
jgi:hypothetical protein